VFTFKTTYEN